MTKRFFMAGCLLLAAACSEQKSDAATHKTNDYYAIALSVPGLDIGGLNGEINTYLSMSGISASAIPFLYDDGTLYIPANDIENEEKRTVIEEYLALPEVPVHKIAIDVSNSFSIPLSQGRAMKATIPVTESSPAILKNGKLESTLKKADLEPIIFAYNPQTQSALCHIRIPLEGQLPSLRAKDYMDESNEHLLSMSPNPELATLSYTIASASDHPLPFPSSDLYLYQRSSTPVDLSFLDVRVGSLDNFYLTADGATKPSDIDRCLTLIMTLTPEQKSFFLGEHKNFTIDSALDTLLSTQKVVKGSVL